MIGIPLLLMAATATGVWFEPRVKDVPTLKAAPYVLLKDGSVLTVEKSNAFITRDEGVTWSAPIPLFPDGPALEVSNERALFRTRDGTILLAFMNLADRYWKWDDTRNDVIGEPKLYVWVTRSLDEGRTWQDAQIIQRGYSGAVRQMIQTKSGRIVVATQNFMANPPHHATVTYSSDDEGLHWRSSNVIDLGGRGHHDGAIEPTLVELRDGRIWMLLRTPWDRFWNAYSDDGGLYWRNLQPSKIEASSSPGYLTRLASGRLLLAWNRLYPEGQTDYPRRGAPFSEQPGSFHRDDLSLAFSSDDGETWSKPVVVARKSKAWLSYPWIFERNPGELWLTTMQGELRVKLKEADFISARAARIVIFGDSLAAPRKGVVTYSDVLARELPGRGVRAEVLNRSVPGNTTEQARLRFKRDVLDPSPDLVVIQLGTNDAAVDVWKTPPASSPRVGLLRYRANLQYFVDSLKKRGIRIIFVTPSRLAWTDKLRVMYGKPPYKPDSADGFNVLLDVYSDVVRGIAQREKIPLIDAAEAVPLTALADGMHPDSDGHRAVANLLLDQIGK